VRLWNIWARCFIGLVTAERGDIQSGTRALRGGLEQAGDAQFLPRFLLLQGEYARFLGKAGEINHAIQRVDETLARSEAREERWYVPELLRIKADLLLSDETSRSETLAETLLSRAIDEAHRQGALAFQLRAALSLAHLRISQTRLHDAHTAVASVYREFSEGFETADLRSAASLLKTLSAPP
jgi:predicted ATPase